MQGGDGRTGDGQVPTIPDETERFPTWRAITLGFVVAGFIAVFPTYARIAGRASKLPAHGLLTALVLLVAINFLAKVIRPGFRMSFQELIIVIVIAIMAMSMVLGDVPIYLIAIIASPHYFASPANQWDTYLLPNLPAHLFPTNDGGEMTAFFTGLAPGEMIPWEAWAVPLFWWFSLLAAMQLFAVCAMVILRKQWVERERLVFPLAEVSIQVASDSSGPRLFTPLLRSRAFWIGVAIPGLTLSWNVAAHFVPSLPRIRFQLGGKASFVPARGFPPIYLIVEPFVVGLAFFANLQVLFSVWFFALLAGAQVGIANRLGFFLEGAEGGVAAAGGVGWQGFGGMAALVILGLWRARRHLWAVARRAFGRDGNLDDSTEILSYRFAFWGAVGSVIYVAAWLGRAGMTPAYAAVILGGWVIAYLAVARIVSETGLLYIYSAIAPQSLATNMLGTVGVPQSTTGALGAAQISFRGAYDTFVMTSAAHQGKLAHAMGGRRGIAALGYISAMGAAVAMAVTGIFLCYKHGAANFNLGPFNRPDAFLGRVVSNARNPASTNWPALAFFVAGALLVWLLNVLVWRFPMWPVHPIGFTVAGVFPVQALFMSTFVAWAAKLIILKIGGIPAYRRAAPLFLGLLVGTVIGTLLSIVTDLIWFPGSGHIGV